MGKVRKLHVPSPLDTMLEDSRYKIHIVEHDGLKDNQLDINCLT